MRRFLLRFSSGFCAFLLASSLIVPVFASGTEYVSGDSFYNWIASSSGIMQKLLGYLSFGNEVCPKSEDGYHHASSCVHDSESGYYTCICQYCGGAFKAYAKDLSTAYDNYVSSLPAQGVTSVGHLIWHLVFSDFSEDSVFQGYHFSDFPVRTNSGSCSVLSTGNGFCYEVWNSGTNWTFYFSCYIKIPIPGAYRRVESLYLSTGRKGNLNYPSVDQYESFNAGDLVRFYYSPDFRHDYGPDVFYAYFPVYEIIPDTAISGDTYNITTRPTSITGGNYGVVGDNNQITVVEDNSPIVDETNNTYYNVTTGEKKVIQDWSYDYGDRSYDLALDSGDKVTVTYGDEQITIVENNTTYNVYYIVDGTGTETPPCVHEWTETSTTPATCTAPGSRLSTCTKCGETKTESIPALGHDWQIKQSVTTEYDDTGQLVQEGYTIYECSRCHEQYKAASGAGPPSNPADPDASGEGVFSGIFGLLLDFLSFFWKTFRDFTKSGVKAFLEALKDGTSDIFGLLNPFDWSA